MLGACGERPTDAADVSVRLEGEAPVLASVVELGERVLDEGKGAGLFRDVGRDLGDDAAFDPQAGALGRSDDRPL